MRIWYLLFVTPILICCGNSRSENRLVQSQGFLEEETLSVESRLYCNAEVVVGAARFVDYLDQLKGKGVAVIGNQSSLIGSTHLVDTLLTRGVNIVKVFSAEHGFRGTENAGEPVKNSVDATSGLPIISLYGSNKKPKKALLQDVDVLLFDIQDVGARFYTYISTLHYVLEAAAENEKKVIVLDRPNPNGHYVDGPVLKEGHASFVGKHRVPIVHGMTIGEYALMINDSNSVTRANAIGADLKVVSCQGWDHTKFYELPIAPSPNLPNMKAIYWYPSLCLFEGTQVSIGRGTDIPFQCVGHPDYEVDQEDELGKFFHFIPLPNGGSRDPKLNGQECYGYDLSGWDVKDIRGQRRLNLIYLIRFYEALKQGGGYFLDNDFFNLLAGNNSLKNGIISGKPEKALKAMWEEDLLSFKETRKQYLLYKDFE